MSQVYQSLTKHFDKLRRKQKISKERGMQEEEMAIGQGRVQWEDPEDMLSMEA